MSVLVVGISHNSAPVHLLERVALDRDGVAKLVQDAAVCEHVTEATVIATCNRLEVYADVDRFHGSVEELSRLLIEPSGRSADTMVAVGSTSILNVAPTVLTVGAGVDVRKVDLSIELQILAYHEQRKAASEASA